jgi:diguanylate cyclase (GGDEF)-like protein/PAS domain S-box-containing protein
MSTTSTGSSGAREAPLPGAAATSGAGSAISLRVRLAFAFGLLAAALAGALSLVIGYTASNAARDEISSHLARLAAEYRDKVDASLAERIEDVASIAYLDTATVDAGTPERRAARMDQLMRNKDFAWVGYIGPTGRVEAGTGGLGKGEDVSGRSWYRAASRRAMLLDAAEAARIGQRLPFGKEHRRFVAITVPIEAGRGIAGAMLDFAWAERLRTQSQYAGAEAPVELLLVQSDGDVLIGPQELIGKKVPLPLGARVGAPAAIERWPDGEEYLAGGSALRGPGGGRDFGWIAIARERTSYAFAPVAELQRAILWAGLALALAGIGIGWLVAGRLARPLETLARAAADIAAGDHRTTLPRLRDNLELARLSDALRAMLSHLREQAESLRQAQDQLDLRVRERTAELVKLQAQLELEIADTMVARDDVAAANERLALAMEASRLALWDYDVERDQIFLSANWSQMLGGPAAETRITSRALAELVPEADRGRVVAAVQRVVKGEAPEYRVEHPVTRRDGGVIWIVSTGRVVGRGADGRTLRILGTNRDITERVQATTALRASEARFKAAFDNPSVGVALVAPDGRFQATNKTMQRMLGYSEAELLATTFRALTHPEDLGENEALFREALEGKRSSYEYEKRFLRKDGAPLWVQVNVALDRDELDLPAQFVCQILDVTDRHEAETRLRELSLHDALTGLPNKRLLADRLNQALARAKRDRAGVGLLYMDLDGFKPVNDRLGHAAGDAVLAEVARRGRAALRDSDTFARIGGDEFVVVLPGTGRETLEQAAQRLLASLSQPIAVSGQQAAIGASIGAALSVAGEETAEALMAGADAAMYEAKRAGRNCIRFHDPQKKEKPQ